MTTRSQARKRILSIAIVAGMAFPSQGAQADELIGNVATSGFLFKDSIDINVFDDPTIAGVACYVTQPNRSMSWEDPTDSSIACRQVGPIKGKLEAKPDVFSASKNPFFKVFHVDRFFDAKRNVLVYLAYTSKSGGSNASHSISVVPIAR